MAEKKTDKVENPTLDLVQPQCPDFEALLRKPIVSTRLPSDFDPVKEAAHLSELWKAIKGFWQYDFEAFENEQGDKQTFVHAGGSGMVFKVRHRSSNTIQALKIARAKLMNRDELPEDAAGSLSPVSERELRALEKLSHENLVRLYNAIGSNNIVVAIATSYVEDPRPLDSYLSDTLAQIPRVPAHAFSPERLYRACDFLLERCLEVAQALSHMHDEGVYHFDIKPANILVSSKRRAILTDLGACLHADDMRARDHIRVHFTWTYAHPDLTTMIHKPGSVSGGGLKASADVSLGDELQKYDLFAFGRMMQEALAILEYNFGERAYAAYGFRYLHLIASLLLDGRNAPSPDTARVATRDGRRFVSDTALLYPVELFHRHRITSVSELVERLKRYSREYSWHATIPELDPWQSRLINTGIGAPAPYTERVSRILDHPVVRRLKFEAQLGWLREVYPGATHNRWSHTIGVFAAVVRFYNSLLADPEVPTLRVLLDADDVSHAMVAALIHDIGQGSFGHDLEASCPHLFDHETIIERLLDDTDWSGPTLRSVIQTAWPNVDIRRVMAILQKKAMARVVDGVAADMIDGPIDADKLDYLQRDSVGCGVPYGLGIDSLRFLQALSVDARLLAGGESRLALAYKAKGSPAIEAVLLARYQMYGAVYWHHTFRAIQAMYSHAVAVTFGPLSQGRRKLRGSLVTSEVIGDLLYHWVICGKDAATTKKTFGRRPVPQEFYEETPLALSAERALQLVWKFADNKTRHLVERLAIRDVFKRVLEVRVSDLGELADYSALKSDLLPDKRPGLAKTIQIGLLNAIQKTMADKGPVESEAENRARERYQQLQDEETIMIILDFPIRGIPNEVNFPNELGDPSRKYTGSSSRTLAGGKVFHDVRRMQTQRATLRIFAADELHELIIRYLNSDVVEACVSEAIPRIRRGI